MSTLSKLPLFLLLACTLCHAEDTTAPLFEIGTEFYKEVYKEQVDGQDFMKEEAPMIGLYGQVHVPFNTRHAAIFTARYAVGASNYTGSMQGAPYGSFISDGQDRAMYDLRATYALTLPWSKYAITPMMGVGYRHLIDRLDQVSMGGYKRTSRYWYLSAGMSGTVLLGASNWKAVPALMYNRLKSGRQSSDGTMDSQVHEQHQGYGIELSSAFSRTVVNKEAVTITPFYRYWHIGESALVIDRDNGISSEPKNNTHEFGVRFSYRF